MQSKLNISLSLVGEIDIFGKKFQMSVTLDEKDLRKLIVVGDRILIRPKIPQSKTRSGLYLPPGVNENEKVQIGYVMKVGPGYPIPVVSDIDEPWKNSSDEPKYVPLQPREGDQAVYMQGHAIEIEFNKEKFIVVPQSAILLLLRDDGLFE
ncbi:MAG: co-chaperone GroES family protein [Bacteroidales bacterium]